MKVAVHIKTGHLVTLQEIYVMSEVMPLNFPFDYKITAISDKGHIGYVVDCIDGSVMWNKYFVEREFEVLGDL